MATASPGVDVEADQRQAVVDDEQLHQQRRALEQRDVAGRGAAHELRCRTMRSERDAEAEDDAADKADRGEQQGPFAGP